MQIITSSVLVLVLFISLTTLNVSRTEHNKSISFEYKLTTKLLDTMSLSDQRKYTDIFEKVADTRLQTVPSLRPPVHILIDLKATIHEYDWVALAAWTKKQMV